jgi:hypothetical protein
MKKSLKHLSLAMVFVFILSMASPLAAYKANRESSDNRSIKNNTITSQADKKSDGTMQLVLGILCLGGGAAAVAMPLLSLGGAGSSEVPMFIGIAGGGAALSILGIWLISGALSDKAAYDADRKAKAVYKQTAKSQLNTSKRTLDEIQQDMDSNIGPMILGGGICLLGVGGVTAVAIDVIMNGKDLNWITFGISWAVIFGGLAIMGPAIGKQMDLEQEKTSLSFGYKFIPEMCNNGLAHGVGLDYRF